MDLVELGRVAKGLPSALRNNAWQDSMMNDYVRSRGLAHVIGRSMAASSRDASLLANAARRRGEARGALKQLERRVASTKPNTDLPVGSEAYRRAFPTPEARRETMKLRRMRTDNERVESKLTRRLLYGRQG